ncbi:arabidopsis Inositol phosphorylceramide synthase2 [Striga asiatica]|uniref:Arabidopsis Inositol phosphorylceramide synthase2 n=1 Tax=Striga asiatica TaxID=4170 RepID=A0A5A7QDY1_STRAF|nr:arabidopsis Inositol phosphorylceramide synthase2 [Striga asiatica]
MATFASFLSCSPPPQPPPPSFISSRRFFRPSSFSASKPARNLGKLLRLETRVLAFSGSSFPASEFSSGDENSPSEKSNLYNLVQDIEPLDVSLIQKDVPQTTIDAMKRTISGMLGLLPSDQFQVMVEALWDPLFKLLISSMMTGYTLRNAEYRLSLERNLEIYVGDSDNSKPGDSKCNTEEGHQGRGSSRQDSLPTSNETGEMTYDIPDFGEMTVEARQYILKLHSRLSSVAELSEPTSPELRATIHSVVHGLLATLSPKMHSKGPDLGDNNTAGTVDVGTEADCVDLVENTSLQFQPLISLPRDYLARLLFWCMLLGHYLRGQEYRLELMELLTLPFVADSDSSTGRHVI